MAETIKKIVFDFDNDNRPMRETVAEGTLFEPQYTQALSQINVYLGELDLEKTEEDRDATIHKNNTEYIPDDIDYNNNIFSFIGDRGTGKTSCMISVASMLKSKEEIDKKVYPNIDKIKFTTIDLIDPAYFDKSHNLLSLFLAKLYKKYSQLLEKDTQSIVFRSQKQKFLQFYRDAHSQLHRLYYEKDGKTFSDEDLMEYVEDVSASVKLKRTIQDLVDAYLECFQWKDTILILRIDDVDMDIHNASKMIETMRKYFVQPNLLVFVSCDIKLLEKIKSGDFKKDLQDKEITSEHRELAERYLAKVFPHSHRIQMPEPYSYHDKPLRIIGNFTTEAGYIDPAGRNESKYYKDFVSVKQAVLELILKKTRYLFYNTNYYESYIVPRNLRELRQLMKLLVTMPDYHSEGKPHPHNKTLFKEYFFDNWVRMNLLPDDRKIVAHLRSIQNYVLFNETLIGILQNRFPNKDISHTTTVENLPVTIGDVIYLISSIEPTLIHESDRKLMFFIKSYYSILLYDFYCEILGDLDNGHRQSKRPTKDGTTTSQSICRQDLWNEFYDFEKLVGGSYLNLVADRQYAVLNVSTLRKRIEDCIQLLKSGKEIQSSQKANILMTELLVHSIYYYKTPSDSKPSVHLYEQLKMIPGSEENLQVVISVGAFLFNITRYEQSLSRFSEDFLKAIEESDKYSSLRDIIVKKETNKDDYGMLYRVALRNFEVLQDLWASYSKKREENKTIPQQFIGDLEDVASYSFPIYEHPKENEGADEYYNISLTFLEPIVNEVKSVLDNNDYMDRLFANSDPKTNQLGDVTGDTKSDVPDTASQAVAGGTQTAE